MPSRRAKLRDGTDARGRADSAYRHGGNIFGVRDGSQRGLKPILFGSHIDSVPSGGNFDGDLGSLSAIEVIRTLKEHDAVTRHPLQVVIWQNEEGGLVGSHAAFGDTLDLERQYNGIRLADGLRKIGGDPDDWPKRESRRDRSTATWSCTSNKAAISPKPEFRSEWWKGLSASTNTVSRSRALRITREPRPCPSVTMPCWRPRS